jgi:hypothetical protein
MLFKRSWLEVHTRLWICILGLIGLMLMITFTEKPNIAKTAANPMGSAKLNVDLKLALTEQSPDFNAVWLSVLRPLLPMMLALYGAMLAGSGINAQTNTGALQSFHPSYLFTLSLPATRRSLLRARALAGMLGLGMLAALSYLALYLISLAQGRNLPAGTLAGIAICAFVGSLLFYAVSTFASIYLSEMWQVMASVFTIPVFALVLARKSTGPWDPFRLMSGEAFLVAGTLPLLSIAIMLAIAGAIYMGAAYALQRREF